MTTFIITFTPYFKKSVLKELGKVDKKVQIVKKLSESIFLIESSLDNKVFFKRLRKVKPIFIKHICPGKYVGNITGSLETDKKSILDLILLNNIDVKSKERFAIQARIIGNKEDVIEYSSKDLEVFIGTYFTDLGGIPTFSDKSMLNESEVKIISIIIHGKDLYIGESVSEDNINFSCDEYRISTNAGKREISRAENKLKEALARYNIKLKDSGIALDIGAAPGGWTKVLVDYGYDVVAVDPGNLHESLQNNPKIKHYKCGIEKLEFENYFDIIVNDMNIDPQDTSNIMNSLSKCLKSKGLAVVTFKLPTNPEKSIIESKKIISKEYVILNINSLFHNRQEVTVLLQKRR